MTVTDLPTLNAVLNAIAGVLLFLGRRAVKSGRRERHKRFMLATLVVSGAFLTSYLIYHAQVGSVRYQGEGVFRIVYFAVLIPHVVLAGLMVPFILLAVGFAYRNRFDRHIRVTQWLWPVWMYVSISGVLVYLMLYQL